MKILHISDTHLGYSAYRKITKDGVNQREKDVYQTYEKFIDYAISNKVDLVLHAGDLFDSVRPNNRAITNAINQVLRLSKNKIPFIVISGNHDQPKLRETGHIFNIFEHIENVYPIYNERYEKKFFKIKNKKVCIHAIPQINIKESFQMQIQQIKNEKQADFNILLVHGSVQGIKEFSMNEFNELMIPKKYLESFFDYCAIGHYHKFTQVAIKAFYSGSIEALTFADSNEKQGFMEINLENNKLIPRFKNLPTRQMIDSKPINCNNLKIDEILTKILTTINKLDPKDKIFRINLKNIASHQYRSLDFTKIRQHSQNALHYEIKAELIDKNKTIIAQQAKIESISVEFIRYLETQKIEDKKNILNKGLEYISKFEKEKE